MSDNSPNLSEYEPADVAERSHTCMVVAATLTAAIASNSPGSFSSPNAIYDAYVKIYHRVKAEDTNPAPISPGNSLL